MKTDANKPTSSSKMPPQPSAFSVITTIADTTWRMFVPSIGGALLGVWADRSFGTAPWLSIAGIIFGTVIVVALIWQQMKATDFKKEK